MKTHSLNFKVAAAAVLLLTASASARACFEPAHNWTISGPGDTTFGIIGWSDEMSSIHVGRAHFSVPFGAPVAAASLGGIASAAFAAMIAAAGLLKGRKQQVNDHPD